MGDIPIIGDFCQIAHNVSIWSGVKIGSWCEIQEDVIIGGDTTIRSHTILWRGAIIGNRCKIGPSVHIQPGVIIGNDCRIHSLSFLCEGVVLADRVFVGHGVIFCNEKYPMAIRDEPWKLKDEYQVFVREDAVIGNGAVILPGVTIGKSATVGAGAVVVDDVPDGMTVISPKAVPRDQRYGNWGQFLEKKKGG